MSSIDLIVPGDLNTATGGYIYDREILAGLAALGWRTTVHQLDASFPQPTPAALREARAIFAELGADSIGVIDGLALPGLDRLLDTEAQRPNLVALVHHPVGLETGLDPELARRFAAAERRALDRMQRIITTSQWTARTLAADGAPISLLRVVEPGIPQPATASIAAGPSLASPHQTLNLLCVATLTPRKGHAVLLEALSELRDRRWHLSCAGSLQRDELTVTALQHQIDRLSLKARISLLGDLDREALARQYARADLFVLASYLEGYGMALAEAVAHGLPIVSTTAGAIPETVPAGTGILVPPGDSRALAKALGTLMDEPARREALAAQARVARRALPSWRDAAAKFAAALDGVGTSR